MKKLPTKRPKPKREDLERKRLRALERVKTLEKMLAELKERYLNLEKERAYIYLPRQDRWYVATDQGLIPSTPPLRSTNYDPLVLSK